MRYFALLTIALGAAACSDDSGWSITEERTETGVARIVNTPPAAGIEPTWTIEPETRIGTVEGGGPASFGTIKGIGVLRDGRIGVLDAQAQEVRIFSADGEHLRTFGRKGAGPGELSDANGLLIGRDGLVRVNDPPNSRLSFFHPDSGFVTSVPLEIRSFGYTWRAVIDTADHIWEPAVVVSTDKRFNALKGYDPKGRWTDTIAQPEAVRADPTRGVYSYQRGTGRSFRQVPYFPTPVLTMDPRRAFWSKPSYENDYRIVRLTFTGDTTLILESRRPAVPVSQATRDSVIAAIRKDAGPGLDWSQIPHSKPIVTQLFIADEGDLWVKVTTADDTLTTFDVFAADGRYKGTAVTSLRVATRPEPIVRGDRFWAVVTDELDVPYIVRGRLVRRK